MAMLNNQRVYIIIYICIFIYPKKKCNFDLDGDKPNFWLQKEVQFQ